MPPAAVADSPFLRACRGESVPHTPVWFMRQAGRALPEYRDVRAGVAMLDACRKPDLVTEITLQPVRRYGVDAAIFFSDIMVPLDAAGVDLDIVPGTGPVVAAPVRSRADVDAIPPLDPSAIDDIAASVRSLTGELGSTPLIGFAGAPFTLASYLVEGGPSRHHDKTKAFMYADEPAWHALLDRLADITLTFLRVQVEAGVAAVQLFDSWAGALSPRQYARYVQPHSAKVLAGLAGAGVPRIHFGVGTGDLLPLMAEAGADVMGVDWRVPLGEADRRLGGRHALQGNLDPAVVLAPWPVVEEAVRQVLADARELRGHVFNLGHGVLPDTDPDTLARIVALVHTETAA